jgi:hypothetical protein
MRPLQSLQAQSRQGNNHFANSVTFFVPGVDSEDAAFVAEAAGVDGADVGKVRDHLLGAQVQRYLTQKIVAQRVLVPYLKREQMLILSLLSHQHIFVNDNHCHFGTTLELLETKIG